MNPDNPSFRSNRDYFNRWFSSLLLIEGQSCLIRDVLRNQKEALWVEWQKVDPYGFNPENSDGEAK